MTEEIERRWAICYKNHGGRALAYVERFKTKEDAEQKIKDLHCEEVMHAVHADDF